MSELIEFIQPENFSFGVPAILVFCIVCVVLQNLSRKYGEKRRLDPEIVGGFFQVIGTIYAVIIGLVVFDATSRFSDAHENVASESEALVSIFMLSKQIKPESAGDNIRNLTKIYVDEVVSHDWTHLQHETVNIKARTLLKDINQNILSLSPKTKNEEVIVPLLAQAAIDAWRFRMSRFDISSHRLPSSEWILLITGAMITICCSFFYYLECKRSQDTLTFLTSFMIASSLYAILMFSEPYKGDFKVSEMPFKISQAIMDGSYFVQQKLD